MKKTTSVKNKQLGKILSKMNNAIVAFSGGVDSTLVLERAKKVLGYENVLAVVVNSEMFREEEFEGAVNLARSMGVKVYQTQVNELENANIVSNTPESWYYSKKLQYSHLNMIAGKYGYDYVLDGMIMDDEEDYRPGIKARDEENIRSILQEANLYKEEIRELVKEFEISVWNKPASCSLASRIPYGTKIDQQKINMIKEAEKYIMQLGVDIVRVRYHDNIARIEVEKEEISKLLQNNEKIHSEFMSIGFDYVTLDLIGYRTGSMNEVLANKYSTTEAS